MFKTKTGELSIHCTEPRSLTRKAYRTRLPDKSRLAGSGKRAIASVILIHLTMNPGNIFKACRDPLVFAVHGDARALEEVERQMVDLMCAARPFISAAKGV